MRTDQCKKKAMKENEPSLFIPHQWITMSGFVGRNLLRLRYTCVTHTDRHGTPHSEDGRAIVRDLCVNIDPPRCLDDWMKTYDAMTTIDGGHPTEIDFGCCHGSVHDDENANHGAKNHPSHNHDFDWGYSFSCDPKLHLNQQ